MIKIVVPAAGLGSRFAKVGYTDSKPFIDVAGKRMLQIVANNLKPSPKEDCQFIFVLQKDAYKKYSAYDLLTPVVEPHKMVIQTIEGQTEGAACTVLKTQAFINNEEDELIICNSDQFLNFNMDTFLKRARKYDGYILTMEAKDPKWSYVGKDAKGKVDRVAEKQVISNEATCGLYYYKRGSDFVKAAKAMIEADDRFNGEFYACPVYNYLLKEGGKVGTMKIKGMHGMGTPEDLEKFLKSKVLKKATKF